MHDAETGDTFTHNKTDPRLALISKPSYTMKFRHRLELFLLALLALFAFASYHEGTGSTLWLQWTTLAVFVTYIFVFDYYFTDDSKFVFDPDADNWRRRTEFSG